MYHILDSTTGLRIAVVHVHSRLPRPPLRSCGGGRWDPRRRPL